MKTKPSALLTLLALAFGGSHSVREIPSVRISPGTRNYVKPQRKRRRKNPFRGTTYARIIGVASHCH